MTTGKTIALTRRTFVGKVMSLLFNMLFRNVLTWCHNHMKFRIVSLGLIGLGSSKLCYSFFLDLALIAFDVFISLQDYIHGWAQVLQLEGLIQ